jgi:hypothetical protein
MGGACSTHVGKVKGTLGVAGKICKKRLRHGLADNIQMEHKLDGRAWSGFVRLRTETSGGLL